MQSLNLDSCLIGLALHKEIGGNLGKQDSSKLTGIDLLVPRVMANLGLDRRLKEHTLVNLWPTVCGSEFSERSRPLFIDHLRQLVVSTKDASTAQELMLRKGKILSELRTLGHHLDVEIKGLRFDLKSFRDKAAEDFQVADAPAPTLPREGELEALNLSPAEQKLIETLINRLNEEAPQRKDLNKRMAAAFERQLRLNSWRLKQGFPTCSFCTAASSRVFSLPQLPGAKLCFPCFVNARDEKTNGANSKI